MKKIMFNDKYGLTDAVLEGRKTQTRRMITYPKRFGGKDVRGFYVHKTYVGEPIEICMYDEDESPIEGGRMRPKYDVGEIVAVAQSYKDAGFRPDKFLYRSIPEIDGYIKETACCQKGWNNKMFVAPNLMPHQILITDVRIERLQDISDEDCIKEGIWEANNIGLQGITYWYSNLCNSMFRSPREAFASLIDKVSGKGTWESNPYVFVYEFELVK